MSNQYLDQEGLRVVNQEFNERRETDLNNLADTYDSSLTYAVGDLVIHDYKLWKCKTAISIAEEWNESKWEEATVDELIDAANIPAGNVPQDAVLGISADGDIVKGNLFGKYVKVLNKKVTIDNFNGVAITEAEKSAFLSGAFINGTWTIFGLVVNNPIIVPAIGHEDFDLFVMGNAADPDVPAGIFTVRYARIIGTRLYFNDKLTLAIPASADSATAGVWLNKELPKYPSNDENKVFASIGGTLQWIENPLASVAPEYDSTATYSVGALVIHEGLLYQCSTAITVAEAWDAAKWTQVTVGAELAGKQTEIDSTQGMLAPEYDATAAYDIGDVVIYQNVLYKCNTAIVAPGEAWDSTHWDGITVASELAGKIDEADATDISFDGTQVQNAPFLGSVTVDSDSYNIPQKVSDLTNDSGFVSNPMTDPGDIIYGGVSGAQTRLAKGAAGQLLAMNSGATAPEWRTPTAGNGINITNSDGSITFAVDTTVIATQEDLQTGEVDLDFNAADSVSVDSTATLKNVVLGASSGTTKYTVPSYSRLTPASGGTAVSLVYTGDMYTWNNKQDALTHVSVSASNLESTILGIIGSNRANMWKIVSIYAYGNASSTATYEALSLKIEDDATDPDNPVTTFSLYKGDGTAVTSPYTGYTFHIVHM